MERINDLENLWRAAKNKKAVVCPDLPAWKKPTPAAFMINLTGSTLLRLFDHGLYIYSKI